MKKAILSSILCLIFPFSCFCQTENKKEFTRAIEDNSMFIEEAYNQEDRVVQHISNFAFLPNLKDNFFYTFTQEWPVFGYKHQLSYAILYNSLDRRNVNGVGDISLNYRYQLSYKDNFITSAPRISVIIPTGNKNNGLGSGAWGLQANLPLSKRWTNHFINHFNVGATYLIDVKKEELNFNKSTISYSAGFSSIWLMTENFNLMLEFLTNSIAVPEINNELTYSNLTIVAPAFRFAINLKKLQIVPGISVPITFTENSKTEVGGFFYLSFEHGY